jgi:hypothetical protein
MLVLSLSPLGSIAKAYADEAAQVSVVSFLPYPGTFELEEGETVEVTMFSMVGADIWYTDNGSNPVSGKWLNVENENLRHYGGYSIPISKTTTFFVACVTPDGLLSNIKAARYTVVPKSAKKEKVVVKKEIKIDPNIVKPKILYSESSGINRLKPRVYVPSSVKPVLVFDDVPETHAASPEVSEVVEPEVVPRFAKLREKARNWNKAEVVRTARAIEVAAINGTPRVKAMKKIQTVEKSDTPVVKVYKKAGSWNSKYARIRELKSGSKIRIFRVAQYGAR